MQIKIESYSFSFLENEQSLKSNSCSKFRYFQMGDSDHETDDITIPRAAMNKMIKELCPQIRVANEAR